MTMFRRHTREPFPLRNIIALSAIVLLVLLFMLQQLKKAEKEAAHPPVLIEQTQ